MTEEEKSITHEETPSIRPYGYGDFLLNLRGSINEFPYKALRTFRLLTLAIVIPACTATISYGLLADYELSFALSLITIVGVIFHREIRGIVSIILH